MTISPKIFSLFTNTADYTYTPISDTSNILLTIDTLTLSDKPVSTDDFITLQRDDFLC